MKKTLKRFGSFLGTEASAVLICIILGFALSALIKDAKIVSVITALIYISMLYSGGWNEGRRDSRKVGESFPDFKGAVKAAFLCSAITLLLLIIRIAVYHIKPQSWGPYGEGHEMILVKSGALVICDVIYRLWNYPFIGFMSSGTLAAYSFPLLFPIIIYPLSYKVGLTRFSIIEKYIPRLVYKPKKKRR